MCDEASTVTDRIFSNVPIRQWVMSLPFELRGLAALKPDVLTAMGRIFAEEIARTTKRLAGVRGAETGAVSFPQRFGGSLNLHVHFHTLAADVVFDKHDGGVRAVRRAAPGEARPRAPRPTRPRARAPLVAPSPLPRRTRGRRARRRHAREGAHRRLRGPRARRRHLLGTALRARPRPDHASFDKKERRFSASYEGFDVHCAVRIERDDDEGRERLVRYCARPAFALDRIEPM